MNFLTFYNQATLNRIERKNSSHKCVPIKIVYRCCDICVAHNFLYDLDVYIVFTKDYAIRMPLWYNTDKR